jgi:hypothetical protein
VGFNRVMYALLKWMYILWSLSEYPHGVENEHGRDGESEACRRLRISYSTRTRLVEGS